MNRTDPKQEHDNRSDNRLTPAVGKSNEPNTEASWRRGYAPDCKAPPIPCKINDLPPNSYQDRPGTPGERDNHLPSIFSDKTGGYFDREKPKTLPGDRGRMGFEERYRLSRSRDLALAIRRTHPDDARVILTAALHDLMAGLPHFAGFGSIREDAKWWAGLATPIELIETMFACMEKIKDRALHKDMRKRLLWAMWRSLDADSRAAFLARVGADRDK